MGGALEVTKEELLTYMMKNKLTNVMLARYLGVSGGAINHWTTGRRDVPPPVVKIIKYFDKNNLDMEAL